jgi:hypothetical protein
MIPLIGTDAFDTVTVNWFTNADFTSGVPSFLNIAGVPLLSSWPANRPPIIRAQLIQFSTSNGFTLDSFNDSNSNGESNANTLFLYPSGVGSTQASFATNDVRRQVNPKSPGSPVQIKCSTSLSTVYYCSAKLTLPNPIGTSAIPNPINPNDAKIYLRLGALYNGTTYQVMLSSQSKSKPVDFNNVEPTIDSTGRANDMFRRVLTRVKLSSDFPYPNGEIFTNGNFCKDFLVTDSASDFPTNNANNSCAP